MISVHSTTQNKLNWNLNQACDLNRACETVDQSQSSHYKIACIASISVGLGGKERPRNGTGTVFCPRKIGVSKHFRGVGEQRKTKEQNRNGILPAWNWGESQNKKEGVGEGKEGNACGKTPGFWKPPFASERSSWVAGQSNIIDMCRSYEEGHACLQKFLAKQGFNKSWASTVRWKSCNAMLTLWDFKARQCDTIFAIFLLRCLKPRLPKFHGFRCLSFHRQ